MKNFEFIKIDKNGNDIFKINGKFYCLCGYNGESYCDSYRTDKYGIPLRDKATYNIMPKWAENKEDNFEIVEFDFI